MSKLVKIKSADGDIFNWDIEIIMKYSPTVKRMLSNGKFSDDEAVVHLSKISTVAMKKITNWIYFHSTIDLESEDYKYRVEEWNKEFLDVDVNTIFDILISAQNLEIKVLMDLCCDKVGNLIKGKQPEELRTLFEINSDLKLEEEDMIRLENEWLGSWNLLE